jgi:hypothetical protein
MAEGAVVKLTSRRPSPLDLQCRATRSTDAIARVLVEHMDARISEIDPDRRAIPAVEGLVGLDRGHAAIDPSRQLHFLDVPEEACSARMHARKAGEGDGVSDAEFDQVTGVLVAPEPGEEFKVIRHSEE